MGKRTGKKYCPSSGTEGMWFDEKFCLRCIHEKFMHTAKHGDKQCEIFNAAFLIADVKHKDFPNEWQYDENDMPICTAWVKWDWGRDDEGNWNDPPEPEPIDPNQLCLPFVWEGMETEQKKEKQILQTT